METENTSRHRAVLTALQSWQSNVSLASRSCSYYHTLAECIEIVQARLGESIEMDREKSEMRADILPFRRSEYDV